MNFLPEGVLRWRWPLAYALLGYAFYAINVSANESYIVSAGSDLDPIVVASNETQERRLYVVVEHDRFTAYLPLSRRYAWAKRQLNEAILLKRTTKTLAVVVTNKRYLGVGSKGVGWVAVRKLPNEQFLQLDVEDTAAIIVTSGRILTFNGRSWGVKKHRRSPIR